MQSGSEIDEFDHIETALAAFGLCDKRLRFSKSLSKLSLRQILRAPKISEQGLQTDMAGRPERFAHLDQRLGKSWSRNNPNPGLSHFGIIREFLLT